MGTLLISVEDLPGKILKQAFIITLPLLLGAFISMVVWALAAFPTPTANAPSAERLALTTVRAVTAHFLPRRGAVAGNAAEPSGSDVFGVFFSSFMVLVLYYLQCKVGSFGSSGLAHAIYLILLYLEKAKPQRHILFATVLLVTIVFKSGDHPYKILDNFVLLLTMWYILLLTVFLGNFGHLPPLRIIWLLLFGGGLHTISRFYILEMLLEIIGLSLPQLVRLQFLVAWMLLIVILHPPVLIVLYQLMNLIPFSHLTRIMLNRRGGFAVSAGVDLAVEPENTQ